MTGLFHELNWSLLATLLIVSAVVAWLGDIIGMKVGKKRITIFKMRPKYTTRLISVLTGVAIAFVTLFASSLASESVRTALFNMKSVKRQVAELTEQLENNKENLTMMKYQLYQNQDELRNKQDKLTSVENELADGAKKLEEADKKLAELEKTRQKLENAKNLAAAEQKQLSKEISALKTSVASLHSEADVLKSNVQHLREDRIAAFAGEILAQGVIDDAKQLSDGRIDDLMDMLVAQSREMLAQRFGQKAGNIPLPKISKSSDKSVRDKLKKSKGRYLVRLAALSNAVYGEPVELEATLYTSKLVYKKNELLVKIKFTGKEQRSEVETKIYNTLRAINQRAVNDGILRDPISGNVGSVDSAQLASVTRNLTDTTAPSALEMRTLHDIYTEGPVTLTLHVK